MSTELTFLGHIISKEGIKTDPEKIEKVKNFHCPENLTQLRGLLGLAPTIGFTHQSKVRLTLKILPQIDKLHLKKECYTILL